MNWARRVFLQVGLGLAGARAQQRAEPGCKVFTVGEARAVEAITEQIIPADDFPGAKEAGVLYYIDGSLAGELRRFRKVYIEGLRLMDKMSRAAHGRLFAQLGWDEQTALLRKLEADRGKGGEFFGLIRQHTMEGYYGDPKYGGNRDRVSWKMIGFRG